jgi:ribose transport system ATP-binding protein
MPRAEKPVLSMRAIEKHFLGVRALSGVDLEVKAGEVHALIGENGAGKSTLMKVLSGAHAPDSGTMELSGKAYAPRSPHEAKKRGVAMIYQELTLAPHLTVEENIVLGVEPARLGVIDLARVRARGREALAFLALPSLEPAAKVSTLSPAERQVVEIARALALEARVIVMDEPTSSLSRTDAERLFSVVDRLRERGVAVIYISHFLEEVRRVAQRFTVLRDGRSVDTGEVPKDHAQAEHFATRVLEAMAGQKFEQAYPRVAHEPGEVLLELREVAGPRLPRRASLTLRRGEILGLAGLVGAGRTELLRVLFGLDELRAGQIVHSGRAHAETTPSRSLAQGMGLLSEDRKGEGLLLSLAIADNMLLSRPPARLGVIRQKLRTSIAQALAARLHLRFRDPEQPVGELSGGNQQKVAIARLLHHEVDVLLLDEPTRGIDVRSKAEIYRLMGELAQKGKAILFVSSYLPELLAVCDRIAVMNRGELSEARPRSEWSEESLLRAATQGAHG